MSQLSNHQEFVFIPGQRSDDEGMSRPLLVAGAKHGAVSVPGVSVVNDEPAAQEDPAPEQPLTAAEQLVLRKEIVREYEALRSQYIAEGEKARFDAQQWAQRLIETTENDIRKLYANNEQDCAKMRKEAGENGYKEGYDRGYSEGNRKGFDEGYEKAQFKCRDILKELLRVLESLNEEKTRYFRDYENSLFDAVFTIANKITVDTLRQKEKGVITRMLREAAKGFRNSEYVRVTLSKLDTEQYAQAGLDELREVFRDSQHIEFEILKDAPSGTLILDDGSEITDAGVSTQLMMIEKLGKGKFRDKPEEAQ